MRLPILLTLAIFSASCLEVIYHPPEPSPTPTATPDPSPEPTGAPTAFPTPSPAVSPTSTPGTPMCDLPPSEQGTCEFNPQGLEFEAEVAEVQEVVAGLVDRGGNGLYVVDGIVKDEAKYVAEVARRLHWKGFCVVPFGDADVDGRPPDETWLKRDTNAASFHWDLVNGTDSSAQTHNAARCSPASF